MLKLSLKQGQYLNIGDNIRVVYLGGSGSHGRFMIDAPRDVSIVRSSVEQNPERNKDTYYPESPISKEAQEQIRCILREEKLKAEKFMRSWDLTELENRHYLLQLWDTLNIM